MRRIELEPLTLSSDYIIAQPTLQTNNYKYIIIIEILSNQIDKNDYIILLTYTLFAASAAIFLMLSKGVT
jgi:hypothetical protein